MIRWSNYLMQFQDTNSIMIYKSISDNLFEIDNKLFKRIEEYLAEKISKNELSSQEKKTISELYMNGFLIEADCDEIEVYEKSYYESVGEEKKGTVYFAPSFECNLRCTYCIVGENVTSSVHIKRMDKNLTNKVAEYIYNSAISNMIEELSVLLYGGEPCLSHKNNIELIKRLMELNEDKRLRIRYTLITNGYELAEYMSRELAELGVNNIQITLDGPDFIHNKRRIGQNGEKTFDRIISNIKKNLQFFSNWVIRVNVDNENVDSVRMLIEQLDNIGLNKKCTLHFNLVDPSDFSEASGYNDYTIHRFKEIYEYGYEKGFQIAPWRRYCSVPDKLYISIDPFGNVYRCPNCMGEEKQCKDNVIYSDHWKYVPVELNEKCLKCENVGVCNGGCDAMRRTSSVGEDYCFKKENYYMAKYYFLAKYHRLKNIERR